MTQNNPSPSIEERAKDYAGKIRDTGMLLKRVIIADAYKAGFIAGSSQGSEGDEWIELKEGNPLPDYDELVLWLSEDGNMHVEALDKDGNPWIFEGYKIFPDSPLIKTTHWHKLPKPPIN